MMRRTKPCSERETEKECKKGVLPRCKWDAIFKCFNASSPPQIKKKKDTDRTDRGSEARATLGIDADTKSGKGGGKNPLDDCFEPSCHSKQELFKMMLGGKRDKSTDAKMKAALRAAKKDAKATAAGFGVGKGTENATLWEEDADRIRTQAEVEGIECPADREELGRQSWTLLHTLAAYYPKRPSKDQKRMAGQFLTALSHLYPCTHCSYYLRESMKSNPPRLESRDGFSTWMCEQHNEVNRRLGKKEFDCSIANILLRWRKGDPKCWIPEGYDASTATASDSFLPRASDTLGHDDE